MNRVFNGLAHHHHISFTSPHPHSAETSCLLLHKLWAAFRYVLKVFSSVTYRSKCFKSLILVLTKSYLGVYSGIFAIYLQCPSDESRTRSANVVFHILCILYFFCAATVVCDLLNITFAVSNKFICKNIIFIISCAVSFNLCTIVSTSN